ncbi:hypothetical protein PR048_022780 [Dryococelus australis]|uniref:Uncharacterized protein n=1 Tax=Dryococelus australis TaxID=614101 RepID=A0ABQ9GSB8_9NEOP|nr:hypothetical protein PR048_022780 [Dryococelus australis]
MLLFREPVLVWWLDYSPPTKASRVRFPAGSLPDLCDGAAGRRGECQKDVGCGGESFEHFLPVCERQKKARLLARGGPGRSASEGWMLFVGLSPLAFSRSCTMSRQVGCPLTSRPNLSSHPPASCSRVAGITLDAVTVHVKKKSNGCNA